MSELLGFGAFLFLVVAFAVAHNRDRIRAFHNREPVSLDALDAQTSFGFRPTPCAVLRCDEGVDVWVHAGHDWWGFCLTHGLPHLRDEVAS